MADIEAESAESDVLAVAFCFPWEDYRDYSKACITTAKWYGVVKNAARWMPFLQSSASQYGMPCDSREAGKAACERHYATGKWE